MKVLRAIEAACDALFDPWGHRDEQRVIQVVRKIVERAIREIERGEKESGR